MGHLRPRAGQQRRLRAALGSCLRDEVPSGLTRDDWVPLLELARGHRLLLQLGRLTQGLEGVPDEVASELRLARLTALGSDLRARDDLNVLAEVLDDAQVPWLVVKGPVLAHHWFANQSARSYADLDVLVEPSAFARAVEAVEVVGEGLLDRNWSLSLQQVRAELSFGLPRGTLLDLHWHLINDRSTRSQVPLSTTELLARRVHVDIKGVPVPTLDAADTLLHLALHTALSGGRQLSWYVDLAQVVASGEVNWDAVAQRAANAEAAVLLAVVLSRTQHWTGAPVPRAVLDELSSHGPGWVALLRLIDVVRPVGGDVTRRLSGQLLLMACRGSTAASARSLLGILRVEFRLRVAKNAAAAALTDAAPSAARDRERYLELVRRSS